MLVLPGIHQTWAFSVTEVGVFLGGVGIAPHGCDGELELALVGGRTNLGSYSVQGAAV